MVPKLPPALPVEDDPLEPLDPPDKHRHLRRSSLTTTTQDGWHPDSSTPEVNPTASAVGLEKGLRGASGQCWSFMLCMCLIVGSYNGILGLGGGGLRDHTSANKLNGVNAAVQSLSGWLCGVLLNVFGIPATVIAAAVCFLSFYAALALVSAFDCSSHVGFPAGLLTGVGNGLMWAAFGLVTIRYCVFEMQAKTFLKSWCFFNLGGILAAIFTFSFTYLTLHTSLTQTLSLGERESLSPICFVVLGGTTALGGLVAWLLLVRQSRVSRADGEFAVAPDFPPSPSPSPSIPHGILRFWQSIGEALKDALRTYKDVELLILVPAFLVPLAHLPLVFNGLNASNFSTAARSLNSALYWAARLPGAVLFYIITQWPQLKPGIDPDAKTAPEALPCRVRWTRRLLRGLVVCYVWAAATLTLSCVSVFFISDISFFVRHRTAILRSNIAAFAMLDSLIQSLS